MKLKNLFLWIVLFFLLFSGVAQAQLNPSSVYVKDVIPGYGALNLGKREDDAHASEDVGVPAWGVAQNPAGLTLFNAIGDYTPIATSQYGGVYGILDRRLQNSDETSLLKAEDSAHSTGDAGVLPLGVRQDTLGTPLAADGDYMPFIFNSKGALIVSQDVATDRSDGTSAMKQEDVGFIGGDAGIPPLQVRDDVLTAGADVTGDGDYMPLRGDNTGALWIAGSQIEDAASASGDRGISILAQVRSASTPGGSTTTNGDYGTLMLDSSGRLWTSGSHTEDEASANADRVVTAGAVRDDVLVAGGDTSTDGDYMPLRGDNYGRLWTSGAALEDAAHVSGESITVMGGRMFTNEQNLGNSAGTEGDYATLNLNPNGAVYTQDVEDGWCLDTVIAVSLGAYASGDYVGDSDDVYPLANIARKTGWEGWIDSIVITDEDAQAANYEFLLFDTDPSTTATASGFTDNSAVSVDDADLVNVACVIPITQHVDLGQGGISYNHDINCHYKITTGTATAYFGLVVRDAPTYTATDSVSVRVCGVKE